MYRRFFEKVGANFTPPIGLGYTLIKVNNQLYIGRASALGNLTKKDLQLAPNFAMITCNREIIFPTTIYRGGKLTPHLTVTPSMLQVKGMQWEEYKA